MKQSILVPNKFCLTTPMMVCISLSLSLSLYLSIYLATVLHHLSVAVSICPKRCSTYRARWRICACVCKRRAVSGHPHQDIRTSTLHPDTQAQRYTHTNLSKRKWQRVYTKVYMTLHTYTANTDHAQLTIQLRNGSELPGMSTAARDSK